MPAKKASVSKYCLHKPSGQAYVRIRGKVVYLGAYNTPESKQEYGRLIAELAAQPAGSEVVAHLARLRPGVLSAADPRTLGWCQDVRGFRPVSATCGP